MEKSKLTEEQEKVLVEAGSKIAEIIDSVGKGYGVNMGLSISMYTLQYTVGAIVENILMNSSGTEEGLANAVKAAENLVSSGVESGINDVIPVAQEHLNMNLSPTCFVSIEADSESNA